MSIANELLSDADAKDVEGKLQAAIGELSGDAGDKLKGDAKQVQAAAMRVGEAVEEGIKSLADKVRDRAAEVGHKDS
jgi:uncharacterized protein YjbJ (UPF0337 family)